MRTLKRFYKDVAVRPAEEGHAIALDGRGVKTPLNVALILPTRALADAVAAEWALQGETLSPAAMPLTQLANTVLDRVRPARESFRAAVAAFGRGDLVCYRAEAPAELVRRQEEFWTPLMDWAAERYGAKLKIGQGIMPIAQPPEALAALERAVGELDDWTLAAAGAAAAAGGSLVLSLALMEGRVDGAQASRIVLLDEIWQAERWGQDREESARQDGIAADIAAAARFAELSKAA